MDWYVYVIRGSRTEKAPYYTGCTNDLKRRLRQHNGEIGGGARYTRNYRPWRLEALYGPFSGRGEAQRAEASVKKLRGAARLRWKPRA